MQQALVEGQRDCCEYRHRQIKDRHNLDKGAKDQTNHLSTLDKKEALSRLIPDTWINPDLASAKAFANWAMDIKTYKLNYLDFKNAKKLLDVHLQ